MLGRTDVSCLQHKINPKLLPFKGPNFKMRVICVNMDATNEAVSPLTYYYGNMVHCAYVMKKAWSYNEVLYTSMLEGLR